LKLQTEKKIKFWISTIAKALVVTFLLVRIYDYFSDSEKEDPGSIDFSSEKSGTQILDSNIVEESSSRIHEEEKSNTKEVPKQPKETIELSKVVKFQGKPLTSAKVIIDNCSDCRISTSDKTGLVTIVVPMNIYKKNLLHNFYVYSNDSLVFERAMRFTDVQFNIY
jgi:hypothetical protein